MTHLIDLSVIVSFDSPPYLGLEKRWTYDISTWKCEVRVCL